MGNKETISKDQAAIMWMVTENFRQGNPMDITNSTKNEVRYQHRGYGKYVEIADLFGWQALNKFWQSVNVDYINGITYNRNNDEADSRILRMSRAAGADLRPLIHFWGVHPNNDDTLKLAMQREGLMPSALIYDQLMHYKTLIPMNNAEFNAHADIVYPERDGSGNPDYGKGWYSVWDDQYNESHGTAAQQAIQDIIDYYFPAGRPNTETFVLTVNNGSGDGNYYAGQTVSIGADPAPAGQIFDYWTSAGNPLITDINAANTTLTMPANDAEVTAVYKDLVAGGEEINLVFPGNGGVLESFTSEYGSGWVATDLTNGITDEDGWSSVVNPGPQEFVYSFIDGGTATLNEAVIYGGTGEGTYFSKDVEVWTSADGNSFTKAAGGTLQNSANTSITLNLGETAAKKVKLVITSGYRTDYWELGEFEVFGYIGSPPPDGTYYLNVNNGSGDGYYEPGQVVTIAADSPPSDHAFDKWEVSSGSPQIADLTSSTTTLTMGSDAATVSAVYKNTGSNNKVKVFIVAGQSNMVGQGTVTPTQAHIDKNGGMGTLEYLVNDPSQAPVYDHLVTGSGDWAEREDVWIVDLNKSGPLSVGYGKDENHIGPEMQFGHVIGNYYDNQVLIIKTSWGGKSLYADFRPPSSGGTVGPYYTMMIDRVYEVLNNIGQYMPGYDGQGYEIAGFGWHQGWNDRIDDAANAEYQSNCVNLINDLRDEFQVPDMPFVLATTGMSGWDETHPRALSLMEAQLAVPDDNRLNKGNVMAVETRDFWRDADVSPADQGYHWNRNAESYFLIGKYMGDAMIELKMKGDDTVNTEDDVYTPPNYVLSQNYPNPFNPSTTISYDLAERSHVTIKVYNVLGKLLTTLVDETKAAGTYDVQFFASNLPSGMYVLQMQAGNYQGLKKMMLIK
jgi:alpha-galactosidase